jgi:hypothetical protein
MRPFTVSRSVPSDTENGQPNARRAGAAPGTRAPSSVPLTLSHVMGDRGGAGKSESSVERGAAPPSKEERKLTERDRKRIQRLEDDLGEEKARTARLEASIRALEATLARKSEEMKRLSEPAASPFCDLPVDITTCFRSSGSQIGCPRLHRSSHARTYPAQPEGRRTASFERLRQLRRAT